MLNRNVFLNLYTMVRSNKKSIVLLGSMLFLLNGCYTYTEFRHPQNGSDGEPLELGDVHLQNGCIECHQEAFSGTTTILPDGVKGKKAWEFFYQTAWWEDSYDLPPIRTQYIDYDDPAMITGPAVPGSSGTHGLVPVPVPAATSGPVFIPTNVGSSKVAIPDAGGSSSSTSDDRRDSQRGGSQSYTPATRSSRSGSHSSSSDSSSSSVSTDSNDSSTTSSRRESNSGGSRGSERRR